MTKTSPPGWETPTTRVNWLLETKFGGNRSTMGKAIGMTHAAVSRAASGAAAPGTRMMSLIVEKLGVNAAWLLHGQGEPFAQENKNTLRRRGTPISDVPLGGVPQSCQSQLSAATLDMLGMLSQTQYWLRLRSRSPLLGQASRGFLENDMILIEADRKLFPQQHEFGEQLCVVKLGTGKNTTCHLAEVTFQPASPDEGDEGLVAELLEYQPQTDTDKQFTLLLTSDGEIKVQQPKTSSKSSRNLRPRAPDNVSFAERVKITPTQIVGVWTGMIYRTN
jgi:ribosomal protein S30